MNVAVCAYGAGNLRSVVAAFRRLGANAFATSNATDVVGADLAVLPGVGSAATAIAGLRERGLDDALRDRVDEGRATLGICLGLQLALDESEEDGGVGGRGKQPRPAPFAWHRAVLLYSRAKPSSRARFPTAIR